MVRTVRKATVLGIVAALAISTAALAVANYSFGDTGLLGDPDQTTWSNGVPQVAVSTDKTVSPARTWIHSIYVSDATLSGGFTSDTACSNQGNCLENWYTRSSNNGNSWSNPVKIPSPAGHTERGAIAVTGKTVIVAMMTQEAYWAGCCTSFDVADPRRIYVSRSTNHGDSWRNATVLPGQNNSSRGDYVWIAAAGANVHVVTTNTETGQIWYWRSTDRGASFANPVSLGTTTATDTESGYVGGFSGLPSVAAAGQLTVPLTTAAPVLATKLATGLTVRSI